MFQILRPCTEILPIKQDIEKRIRNWATGTSAASIGIDMPQTVEVLNIALKEKVDIIFYRFMSSFTPSLS